MSIPRFPFQRLLNDLCSKILKTMDPLEIIAYSLTSKKAVSLVQSFRLSHEKAQIITAWSFIWFIFGYMLVKLKWRMGETNEEIMSLCDIPVKFELSTENILLLTITWSNQKMSLGEWIQHICSIFRCEHYEAEFHIFNLKFDIKALRNNFPKLRGIDIICYRRDPSGIEIQTVQNILRAFLPYVRNLRLDMVPLQENNSIQHIGMANLKDLKLYHCLRNPKFEDFLTLNVERCTFHADQFSLRDLNSFFKLWKKGSFPRLKYLEVHGETIPDFSVFLKGLQADETEEEIEYTIRNCYGIFAKINTDFTILPTVTFLVLN